MSRPIPISKLPTHIIISEILTHERDTLDLTYEEVLKRGDELDCMNREQITSLYIEILLS
jgi:uncharacterized Zn finger protein